MRKEVVYYRVSAAGQEAAAARAGRSNGCGSGVLFSTRSVIVAPPFVEADELEGRLELEGAINCCRRTGAVLVVPTLEHLSGNSLFLLTIRDSGVAFVTADIPDADNPSIGIKELVAEQERKVISMRTRAATAYRKRAGAAMRRQEVARRQRLAWTQTSVRPWPWEPSIRFRCAGLQGYFFARQLEPA